MKIGTKTALFFVFTLALVAAFQIGGREAQAQSSYFTSQGCSGCHTAPAVATCNGCHAHGVHSSSAKSDINVKGTTNATSYAPGATVTVTISGGYRSGWVRAVLYDQNQVELARSTGNASDMGSATTLPATLSAAAPATPGTYAWKVAWYGNKYDSGSAAFGSGWTADPNNADHGYEIVSTNSFTVTAPADTTPPTITAFTLPASATSLTVPVSALSATDNTAVTGYLITTSTTAPAASDAGWSATAPTSVTATAAGSATFYAWAKDKAGNVSASASATVTITLPDTTPPTVTAFTLPASTTSLTVPVNALSATDNTAVTGYLITTSAAAPAASDAGWSATAPTSVTAPATGSVTFYAWAKDGSGNVSAAKSATVTVSIPPAANLVLTVSTVTDGSFTNNPTLNVSGTVTDTVAIQSVTVNGQAAVVAADGSFSSAVTLQIGANAILVVATDSAGIVKSDSRTVTYDPTAPVVTVSAPADNSTSALQLVTVTGSVNETSAVAVSVNDGASQAATISGSTYSTAVNLALGVNTISVTATDPAGNSSSIKRTVTYTPPTDTGLNLAVTYPSQDMTTSYPRLYLRGKVADTQGTATVTVTVGTTTYTPEVENGWFQQLITFTVAKQYTITVTAKDQAGNSSSVIRNVIYRPLRSDDRDRRRYDD
ncbi:hypothetical protein FO488_05880 [Geobacter sp. FeAm09]|uniref:hypothetical protein n=1 Tax=Geobacter sp. FeAm09 TaxID=2597769 RepID=UPI0011ED05F9|nr:hypothetical protein [Geobacter sp. FeAm09]QEM67729.1 hypothetical protein FO488_05880 [Geobacter sp. FeAm09]